MRFLLVVACVSLLCSCAAGPQIHAGFSQAGFSGASYGLGPTSANDPRLREPRFYMDAGDDLPAWTHAAPQSNR